MMVDLGTFSEYTEEVTVVRFEQGVETIIADNVLCFIEPQSVRPPDYKAMLQEANKAIAKSDIFRRENGTRLQVQRVLSMGNVMQLELEDYD